MSMLASSFFLLKSSNMQMSSAGVFSFRFQKILGPIIIGRLLGLREAGRDVGAARHGGIVVPSSVAASQPKREGEEGEDPGAYWLVAGVQN